MDSPTSIDILNGLILRDSNGPRPLPRSERDRAYLVALALSPEGLTYEEQWELLRDDPFCAGRLNTLAQERSRFKGRCGIEIKSVRATGRSHLEGIPDEAIDSRHFLAACARAESAESDGLGVWHAALELWPREKPLADTHFYLPDAHVFSVLEKTYRRVLIGFGEAIVSEETLLTEDLRLFKDRGERLLAELEPLFGPGKGIDPKTAALRSDARALRHLLVRLSDYPKTRSGG